MLQKGDMQLIGKISRFEKSNFVGKKGEQVDYFRVVVDLGGDIDGKLSLISSLWTELALDDEKNQQKYLGKECILKGSLSFRAVPINNFVKFENQIKITGLELVKQS